MKLLFDQNLSPRLVERLSDLFPYSTHVFLIGLDRASDERVFEYALQGGYTIVSKDSDFAELVTLREDAPKVVWLRLGNSTTGEIEAALRGHPEALDELERDPNLRVLELS